MFAVGSLLYAQPSGSGGDDASGQQPAGNEDEAKPAGDLPDITVPMEKQARLAPNEMLARVDELITQMKQMLERVIAIQQVARKQKDVIRLNCVNDRLIQVKKLLNIAEAARSDLVEAAAGSDENERYHQLSKVTIAHENVSVLRDEAEGCVGEELIFLGPTKAEMFEPDPPIIDDPTAQDPFDYTGGGTIQRPDFATPFL